MLSTYSFDFKDNDINFQANNFQPSQDRPWVDVVRKYADTQHFTWNAEMRSFTTIFEAVDARDLPCMADVESSMLYFCRKSGKAA